MWGLIIGSLYALILWIKKEVPERIFMKATNFLFYWYLIVTAIIVSIIIVICSLGGAVLGAESDGLVAVLVGSLAGSGLGIVIAALVVLFSLFSIIGAHLLRTSVTEVEGAFKWDRARLVIGIVLFLISLLLSVGTGSC